VIRGMPFPRENQALPRSPRRVITSASGVLLHQLRQTHFGGGLADGLWLFLSSANLTEYAFSINMELGMLITGGNLPSQVAANFDRLIEMGVLERV